LQSKLTVALRQAFLEYAFCHLTALTALIRDAELLLNVTKTASATVNSLANLSVGDLIADANVHINYSPDDALKQHMSFMNAYDNDSQ